MGNFLSYLLNKKILVTAASSVLIVSLLYGSFYYGYELGRRNPETILVSEFKNIEEGRPQAVDFNLFWEVWQKIKEKHVDSGNFKNQDYLYGAIAGLISTLNDPNSSFFPPSDAKKFSEDLSGEFSGIGAEIGIRNNQLVIVAPLKDSPAERSGLKAGDKILEVDKTTTNNLSVEEAVKIIRGERGTVVNLLILRDGWAEPKEVPIKRDLIQLPTLDFEMKGDIAYIRLYNFFEKAPYQFYQTGLKVMINNAKGIVLDLRNNPGGFLEIGTNIAGWFLEKGQVVVKEQFKSQSEQVFVSQGPSLFKDIPVVVLVNEGSASASEILTGALKDNRGVKVVGKKTFGKGTVQELVNISDDSLLKVTIAHWLTPNGHQIEKNGIMPDYVVDITEEDVSAGKDPQLEKALEIIESQVKRNILEFPELRLDSLF